MVPSSSALTTAHPKSSPNECPLASRLAGPLPTPGTGEVPAQRAVAVKVGGEAAGGASRLAKEVKSDLARAE